MQRLPSIALNKAFRLLLNAALIALIGLPLTASTMVTVTCSNPNQTTTLSDPVMASCYQEDVVYGGESATASVAIGSLYVNVGVGSVYYAPYANGQASFDAYFPVATTITWTLVGYGATDVGPYLNAYLYLGPTTLSGDQILNIIEHDQGIYTEQVPAGDWTFTETAEIADQGNANLSAHATGIPSTPEPATWMLFICGAAAIALRRLKNRNRVESKHQQV